MKRQIIISFSLLLITVVLFSQGVENRILADEYIKKYKDIAIKEMYESKIPASITLAQGILESGYGNSELAQKANNHFGIKCHKEWTGKTFHMDDDEKNECFRKYSSAEESFRDHTYFLTSRDRYTELFELDITDYKSWAHGLKKAGYATNPRYAHILIKIIEENKLYIFDQDVEKQVADNFDDDLDKDRKLKKSSSNSDDFESIVLSTTDRKVYLNNGIRCIKAKKGDNFRKIADAVDMLDWQIARYNDMKKNDRIKEDQIIYIQPKKRKGNKEYHHVGPHETMHYISQQFGIKLKQLYKKNNMPVGSEPRVGQTLWLRKRKK